MIDGRRAGQNGREPGAAGLQAEIQILEAEEVILVEEADGLEHLAPDEHQAAAHAVDGARQPAAPVSAMRVAGCRDAACGR